jgi:glycosyltransferase involved in cell wall biosynthesis
MLKKYLFVIDRLENGGAERQLVNVAKYLCENVTIYITSLHPPSEDMLSLIKKNNFIYIPISMSKGKYFYQRILGIFNLIKSLKLVMRNHEIDRCISFLEWSNILSIIAVKERKIPITINVRNYLSTQYGSRSLLVLYIAKVIISRFYICADKVLCNSSGIKKDLVDNFKIPSNLVGVIQNTYPIDTIRQYRLSTTTNNAQQHSYAFCTCGRLSDQKRFESLIMSFQSYIKKSQRKDSLIIIGSGPNEDAIQNLIVSSDADIKLVPHQENPYPIIASSDCFILHSAFEGFPNVLAEALIIGNDCISVDCMSGPREVLSGNKLIDYDSPVTELKVLKYGILYPYIEGNDKADEGLISALTKYVTNEYSFDKNNIDFLCEKEGKKKWLQVL